jgi:hypothetical protein
MSTIVTTAEAIPSAPYYVLSDDAFMSDWGEAQGRVNTIILPCSDWAEAETVATNAATAPSSATCGPSTASPPSPRAWSTVS